MGASVTALALVAACSAAPVVMPSPTESPTLVPTPSGGVVTPSPSTTPTVTPTPSAPTTPPPTPPAPTPRPTVRPTPAPTSTTVISSVVRHGSRTRGDVALTFDMGGRVGDAVAIVEWLVANEVHATVFMTGAMADNPNTNAGRRVLAIVDAHSEFLTLGNHSYSHPDFRTLSASQMRDELSRTEAALARYGSQDPRPLFRPPYGGYDDGVLAVVGAAGYGQTVMWDIDTIDWRPIANDPPGPTADEIVAKVVGNAQGGSIVLMHLGGYQTYVALPRVVAGLQAKGYRLVTLDELLGT